MVRSLGRPPLGRPTSAQPLGASREPQAVQSARGVGLKLPGRGDMDATEAFNTGTEVEDEEPVDPLPTERHRRALPD